MVFKGNVGWVVFTAYQLINADHLLLSCLLDLIQKKIMKATLACLVHLSGYLKDTFKRKYSGKEFDLQYIVKRQVILVCFLLQYSQYVLNT